jgi:hypothetical protein
MLDFYGLSQGHESTSQAEHWLVELVSLLGNQAGTVACTHFVRTPYPHVAVSLAVPSHCDTTRLPTVDPELKEAAAQAMADHVSRHSGRAVIYPGVDELVGTLTVAELVERSAIDRVVVLGKPADPAADTLVDTRDFVRPEWRAGRLTLVTTPAPDSRIAPFEIPNPPQCCADH